MINSATFRYRIAYFSLCLFTIFSWLTHDRFQPTELALPLSVGSNANKKNEKASEAVNGVWKGSLEQNGGNPQIWEAELSLSEGKGISVIKSYPHIGAFDGTFSFDGHTLIFEDKKPRSETNSGGISFYRKRLVFFFVGDREMIGQWFDADGDKNRAIGRIKMERK